MYLGYQKGKVKSYTEYPLDMELYNLEKVEETEDEYVFDGDQYVLRTPEWDEQQLSKAKQAKCDEALKLAKIYEQEGTVEHKNCVFEMSDSNRRNLSDTEEALTKLGETETTWLDKDDNFVTLTVEDIQYIRLNLILGNIQQLWIYKYPGYLRAIEEAATIEEVENIVINYEVSNGINI